MKKVICALLALVLSVMLPISAFATEFVVSVGYKDHPEVDFPVDLLDEDGNKIGEIDEGCLVITSVAEVEDSDEIPEDAREELLEVYKQLTDGTMTLPYDEDGDYVIRDLIDVSLICTDGHKELVEQDGVYIEITFDLGVVSGEEVIVMVYVDGKWEEVPQVTNNGDGTVTVLFEDICPVTFSVKSDSHTPPAQTGDTSGVVMWMGLMAVSAAALVALVVFRRKIVR